MSSWENMYSEPAKYGLETVGEIDWSDGCYQFDLTVVWKRISDGAFVYGEDAGCSCPSPFEDTGVDGLVVLGKRGALSRFRAYCAGRNHNNYGGPRNNEILDLIERMRSAGAR